MQPFLLYLYVSGFVLYCDHWPLMNILSNSRSLSSAYIERLCSEDAALSRFANVIILEPKLKVFCGK